MSIWTIATVIASFIAICIGVVMIICIIKIEIGEKNE